MTRARLPQAILICVPLMGAHGLLRADPPADERARAEEFRVLAQAEAAAYTIQVEGRSRPLSLQPEPVLKWSNPVVGAIYGDVFVWTDEGRPDVVASIYKWYSAPFHRANEFHSLAVRPLRAERGGVAVWTSSRPGVELKPIEGAAAPADTAVLRLRQMRALAQEFTGRQLNREGLDREMRLLPQPIYRYENTRGDLIDGGLFVFVLGTDPEAFLLIEARQPAAGGPQWQYGAARMSSINLRINHHGREVWNAPVLPWSQVSDRNEPYTFFQFESEKGR